jgi:hypothetical protein
MSSKKFDARLKTSHYGLPHPSKDAAAVADGPTDILRVRVRVTLRLTVIQSVCIGVEPSYGTFDHRLFIFFFF